MKNFKSFLLEELDLKFLLNSDPNHYNLMSIDPKGFAKKITNKDIIGAISVSTLDKNKIIDRYIIRPDSFVKQLGKGVFHCYSYKNDAFYLIMIDKSLKVHFVDENKTEDDENPVFETRGYKLTEISAVSTKKGKSGESQLPSDFAEFKNTEFGKNIF